LCGWWQFALQQLAVDDLAMNVLDRGVARRARRGDVGARDRRLGVGVLEDRVRRVARHAGRRHDKPLRHQGFAVDGLRVVADDVRLVDRALFRDAPVLRVALAAEVRDARRLHRRARILAREDLVIAVAVHAAGRERVAPGDRAAVERCVVLRDLDRVAALALRRLERLLVREVLSLQVGVAVGARRLAVHGGLELRLVDEQRDGFAVALLGEPLVAVTAEAVVVRLCAGLGRETRATSDQQQRPQPGASHHMSHSRLRGGDLRCGSVRLRVNPVRHLPPPSPGP